MFLSSRAALLQEFENIQTPVYRLAYIMDAFRL